MEEGEVYDLILCLKKLKDNNSLLLSSISDFDLLIESLEELNNMVEMDDVKISIIAQIKFLLVNTVFDHEKRNFENHMLHTVLCGSPGTGKSALGIILSKIWLSLGLLKKDKVVNNENKESENKENNENKEGSESNENKGENERRKMSDSSEDEDLDPNRERILELEKQVQNLISSGKIKNKVVKNLQNHILNIKDKLKDLNSNNKLLSYRLKTLKRQTGDNILLNDILDSIKSLQETLENIYTNTIPDETTCFTIIVHREHSDSTTSSLSTSNSGTLKNKENALTKSVLTKGVEGVLSKGVSIKVEEKEISNKEKTEKIEKIERTDKTEKTDKRVKTEVENIFDELKNYISPKKNDEIIKIVSREDFVGGFLGQTAMKTEKLLKDSIGKVLFIDEAYSLINDEKDSYGREALCVLNRFMSEHPSELIIIFAGYKEMLDSTIFYYQPGLKRRCAWNFEIKGYSENGLAKIFESQLKENDWALDPKLDIVKFFKNHLNEFPNYGGDTLRLAFYTKICYSSEVFDNSYPNEKVIDEKILNRAFKYLQDYSTKDKKETNHHVTMFM
jgi:hypothetical protein